MSTRPLLSISSVAVEIISKGIFSGLSMSVHGGEIVALVGGNGCGKSTLFRLIETAWKHDDSLDQLESYRVTGTISVAASIGLVHIPQQIDRGDGGDHGPYDTLSEGERQRKLLSDAVARREELYLFDEPTNYLDIDGIVWFEQELLSLKARGAGVLIVSHDRTLINNVADRTVYLTPNGIYQTRGGYASAQELAATDFESKRHQAAVMGNKIRQLESEARSRISWATQKEKSKRGAGSEKPHIAKMAAKMAARGKAARVKAEKEVARLKEAKPFVPKAVQIRLPEYTVRNRTVCSLEEVAYAYEKASDLVLQDVTLGLSTTDRVCVIGANGSGKSTLLRLITGELTPTAGKIRRNEAVPIAYVPQGLKSYFRGETLLEALAGVSADEATVRTVLGGVMIRGDKVHQELTSLSPGELTRAALIRAMVERAEFLLLDEPTSHLDIESVELLESVLRNFPGGYLIISHDRSFVEAVADRLYVIERGRLKLL